MRRRPRCPGAAPEACGRPGAPSGACAWRRPSAGCRRRGEAAARRRREAAGSRQVRAARPRTHVLCPVRRCESSSLRERSGAEGWRRPEAAVERELRTRGRGRCISPRLGVVSEAPKRDKVLLKGIPVCQEPSPSKAVPGAPP